MRRNLALLFLVAACGGGGSSAPDAQRNDGSIDSSTPDAMPSPDGEPQSGTVQCPSTLPAPTEGGCDVSGSDSTVIVRQGDDISYVGCNPPDLGSATVITCAGASVSPGLINAHDHITFDDRAPLPRPVNERFEHRNQWRDAYPTPPDQTMTGHVGWSEIRINGGESEERDL